MYRYQIAGWRAVNKDGTLAPARTLWFRRFSPFHQQRSSSAFRVARMLLATRYAATFPAPLPPATNTEPNAAVRDGCLYPHYRRLAFINSPLYNAAEWRGRGYHRRGIRPASAVLVSAEL